MSEVCCLKEFGHFLNKLRLRKGLTLVQASERIGISYNYLSELENGKKAPKDDQVVRKIADLYDVNEDKLFRMLGRLPLGTLEHIRHYSPALLSVLSEVERNVDLTPEQRKSIEEQIINIYKKYLDKQ